jgi:predicted solute-binding protein
MQNVVDSEWRRRGVTRELAHEYMTHYIRYEIADEEWRGADAFLELAGLPPVGVTLAEAR